MHQPSPQQGGKYQQSHMPDHRVVFVQHLPAEVSEEDIIPHANKVGHVTKRFVQEKNRHVFIEMETHAQAQDLVETLKTIYVKGHQLVAELSSRYPQVSEEKVNKILVLTLHGLVDGQTDCFHLGRLFNSKGGQVRKIQLWSKDGLVSGLVEMDSDASGQVLREQLSGYAMGSAMLRLSYSNKASIEIKQPQHGYNFQTKEGSGQCPKPSHTPPPPQQQQQHQHHHQPQGGYINGPTNHNHQHHAHAQPYAAPQAYHQTQRHQYMNDSNHHTGGRGSHHHSGYGNSHQGYTQQPAYIDPVHSAGGKKGAGAWGDAYQAPPQQQQQQQSPTVLVKNLLDETVPDAVFRLFGICGDIRAVKIWGGPGHKSRTTNALVQYSNPQGAAAAVEQLNGCPWYFEDRLLEVCPSRVLSITGPEDGLTQYYAADDVNHRFNGRSAQKNLDNMHGPNNQLHISNVPVKIANETVEEAIRGYSDKCTMRWIENKAINEPRTKMCIATMESVRSAVAALVGLHTIFFGQHVPTNGKGIVVSFCRRNTSPQKATVHPVGTSARGLIPDPTRFAGNGRHEERQHRRSLADRHNDMSAPGHP